MIIGVAGPLAVGKDTVSDILTQQGFVNFSYGDYLRRECARRGLPIDRPTLVWLADEYRSKDPAYLSKELIKDVEAQGVANAVLSGIRAPGEIEALRSRKDFQFWWIDAPIEIRYKRIKEHPRDERDTISFEEFKAHEHREIHGINTQINFTKIKEYADRVILNDGDINLLKQRVTHALAQVNL